MKFWTLMYPLVINTSKPNTHLQAIMRPHFRFLTLGSTYRGFSKVEFDFMCKKYDCKGFTSWV